MGRIGQSIYGIESLCAKACDNADQEIRNDRNNETIEQ